MSMVVIKFIEAIELPATCAGCSDFMDELCVEFPAVYDIHARAYLCQICAEIQAPAVAAMLSLIMAGALFAYQQVTESPDAGPQSEWVKECCIRLHHGHFAQVYGRPEPDYYLTSEGAQ